MGNSKLVFVSAFLVAVIIFCCGIVTTEERVLLIIKTEHMICETCESTTEPVYDHNPPPRVDSAELESWMDDLRPTLPGHSPGAGHSVPSGVDIFHD
ncbi:hypothetical protein O6P43_018901 [Quillaja saponaria]|uniref:Uncharacterized protein n=1 Tax=Quillaja saponaria TaxID=32244 RepID=A0AAD7LHB3_QUISA|nr:hypothetical protein O6P43_018901 [Quillaja saponaria]